jgi:hypothetical protein
VGWSRVCDKILLLWEQGIYATHWFMMIFPRSPTYYRAIRPYPGSWWGAWRWLRERHNVHCLRKECYRRRPGYSHSGGPPYEEKYFCKKTLHQPRFCLMPRDMQHIFHHRFDPI